LVTAVSSPDSLCVDVQGNVYIGTSQGLLVVRPDGTKLGTIPLKSFGTTKAVTSCDFGNADGKTLYVSAWSTLSRIDAMPIPGNTWATNEQIVCP
jgi:gluconolactonase